MSLLTIFYILTAVTLVILFFLAFRILKMFKKERVFNGKGILGLIIFIFSFLLVSIIEYCLYHLPDFLFMGVPWAMIDQMGPTGFINAVMALAAFIVSLYIYLISFYYIVKGDRAHVKILTNEQE